ncbi:MAG: UDP-N-acetylmuramoyl-tripeptide--D-alanyl-D-alanine ligase [Spirochaetaceae bacterium]|jgi:UDP-N-acetylmuramoyl-tripeptide--D-alanyl-D-alanine ligase|nr:UDP-N-acetylmuramoyl-tripeptide--D-alanyl-D-alanine ligase [Spirochaetaceae bacterium]
MESSFLLTYAQLGAVPGVRILSYASGGKGGPPLGGGFSSVCIDSREVKKGSLFVALKGASQDGHRYAEAAFRAGAGAVMAASSALAAREFDLEGAASRAGAVLVVTEDTLRGLQDAARVYLEQFPDLLKIAISGSSGKSTTKEIAAAMIGSERNVVFNSGNLNSETGLPLSVFRVRREHQVGIFEMGMNRAGEIAELARLFKPCIALITNIGPAHIGILGSIAAILEEKKQIFGEFTGNETALIPDDDEYRDELARGVSGKIVFYGPASLEELGEVRDLGLDGAEITWEGISARFALPGRHNLKDALAAAAIAKAAGVSAAAVRRGLESVRPLFGRSEILRGNIPGKGGRITLVRDCYNANPDSTSQAIAFCDGLDWPGRKVYVAGSMLELGEASRAAHERMGGELAASGADMVFFYGRETEAAAEEMGARAEGRKIPLFYTDVMDTLASSLADYVQDGDLVLLKGSRGCALEQLTDVLVADAPGKPAAGGQPGAREPGRALPVLAGGCL